MIDQYKFGLIKISGIKYSRDLIILSNQVVPNWRRNSVHLLKFEDIQKFLNTKINLLIVGTGVFGLLKIDPQCISKLNELDIEVESYPTAKAVKRYNMIKNKDSIFAAFHLTC